MTQRTRNRPDDGIFDHAAAVTPADGADLPDTGVMLYIGTGGDVKVTTAGGETVTFSNVPGGSFLPVRVARVYATLTTASNIVYVY